MSRPSPGGGSAGPWFGLHADFTPELTSDVDQLYALVTVRSTRGGAPGDTAEIIIVDRSRHMQHGGTIFKAREAARAAIGSLPDGTLFAVIAGNHQAARIYPSPGSGDPFARAGARARDESRAAVFNLAADGGAAVGQWLIAAGELFRTAPAGHARHAVLYTGGTSDDTPAQLEAALAECGDIFGCDVRGVGIDQVPGPLASVAEALHGSAEPVPVPGGPHAAPGPHPARGDTFLRLTVSSQCRLESVTQVEPARRVLRVPESSADSVTDLPLAAWSPGESRAYLVKLRVTREEPSDTELPAAWIDVVTERSTDGARLPCAAQARLTVRDLPFPGPGPVDLTATRAADWDLLTDAAQAGVAAYRRDDRRRALDELERAVGLARRLGSAPILRLLERIVDIDQFGRVTLRAGPREADLVSASAAVQARARQQAGSPGGRPLVTRTCPAGHQTTGPEVNYCEEEGCRHQFPAG